jgi:XTP/dITP diphosphohydrolase
MQLVIATRSRDKLREIREVLSVPGVIFSNLADFPGCPEAAEDGSDFFANALQKAQAAAYHTGLPSLADDSGLEVDALGGRPGIHSARFAGTGATGPMNNDKLLQLLAGIPDGKRQARFVCVVALVAGGRAYYAKGEVAGVIDREPRGTGGFGYDPVFWLPDRGQTMAELEPGEKNKISHRSLALQRIRPVLLQLAGIEEKP